MSSSKLLRAAFALILTTTLFVIEGTSERTSAQALPVDPLRTWKVIETAHFEVIFDEPNRPLAQKFANEAERAYSFLAPILQTTTRSKVPIVVADITDDTNGEASAIPTPEIVVYPVLPSATDPTTSEYYDWPRELATHEFTHIMNFEPVSGFMKVLRFVFGSFITPGGYLPAWYTEGLAVEMESRLTPVGRGRSNYYSALVRSMVEDGTWGSEGIDQIGSRDTPTWPRGQRPYTYGYFLMHELGQFPRLDSSQQSVYGILDNDYGGRIPAFLNGPVKEEFGEGFPKLLDDSYARLALKAQDQIKKLKAAGAKNGTLLAQPGYMNFGAQVSPDHLKLAAIIFNTDEPPSIRIWTRKDPAKPFTLSQDIPAPAISGKGIHQLSWRADSRHIVYDHSDTWHHYNSFNDLYELDLNTRDEKRLTEGMRAREATVMADNSLVFIAATSTKTILMRANADGKNISVVYAADGDRLSSPRPFDDGVIFSHRNTKGREWIEKISLKDKKIKVLTQSHRAGEIHVTPVPDPKAPGWFYYASSTTGVMNVYRSDGVRTEPVTNVTTYATSPAIDPTSDELIYTRLTSRGFELEAGPLHQKTETIPAAIPAMEEYPQAQPNEAPKITDVSEHNYHGVSYLFPQYIFPFIYFVPGGAIIDVSTSGADPLDHHEYSLDLGYDTRAQQPYENVYYTNASLPFFIDAAFNNDYLYLVGAGQTEQTTIGHIDTRHFLFSNNKWTIGPELTYEMISLPPYPQYLQPGLMYTQAGPGIALNYNGVAPVRDYQVSPESGLAFSVGYDYFLSGLGNTTYPNVHGAASWYLSGQPLPKHHVLSLKATAWVTPSQQSIYQGAVQSGGEYFGSLLPPAFLVRGYTVGEFIGWTTYVGNLEYRFPIAEPFKGWGTFPLFLEKVHGALLFDTVTLQGGYYDSVRNGLYATNLGTFYCGSGAELRADMEVFYGIPVTMRLGAYWGFTQNAYGGFNYMVSFGSVL